MIGKEEVNENFVDLDQSFARTTRASSGILLVYQPGRGCRQCDASTDSMTLLKDESFSRN